MHFSNSLFLIYELASFIFIFCKEFIIIQKCNVLLREKLFVSNNRSWFHIHACELRDVHIYVLKFVHFE